MDVTACQMNTSIQCTFLFLKTGMILSLTGASHASRLARLVYGGYIQHQQVVAFNSGGARLSNLTFISACEALVPSGRM